MKLFRKKEETKSCCCSGNWNSDTMQQAEQIKKEQGIKILGSGCAKWTALEKATRCAIAELGLSYEVEHIGFCSNSKLWCYDNTSACFKWKCSFLWESFNH